jgi:hypothetical protein
MPTIVVSESASQAISSAVTAVALKASVSGKHGPEFLPGHCYLRVNQAFRVTGPNLPLPPASRLRNSGRSKADNLFDHLVGAGEQRRRHFEAERLRGFEIDRQLELDGCLDWKFVRLRTLEDAIGIGRRASKTID